MVVEVEEGDIFRWLVRPTSLHIEFIVYMLLDLNCKYFFVCLIFHSEHEVLIEHKISRLSGYYMLGLSVMFILAFLENL